MLDLQPTFPFMNSNLYITLLYSNANFWSNSAGGGGKTKKRQDKIKEKNLKLNENRAKRIERERVEKEENARANADTRSAGNDGIHPSRRAHIPGNHR